MAILVGHCQFCGAEINIQVGQSVQGQRLVWHRSYYCQKCGGRLEVDGRGDAPDDVRSALIAQEGEWCIRLESTEADLPLALKSLRQLFGLSLVEIGQLRKKIPGIVFIGTRAEANRLSNLLLNAGLIASVAPSSAKL